MSMLNNRPQGYSLNNLGKGPLDDATYGSQKMESAKLLKDSDSSQNSGHINSSDHPSKSSSGQNTSEPSKKSRTEMMKSYKIKRKPSTGCSENSNSNTNGVKKDAGKVNKSGSEIASTSGLEKTSASQDKTNNDTDKPQKRSREEEKRDRHKRKKQKRKDAKYEGERIPHLDKMKAFKAAKEESDKADEDNYVLQRLFKKTGIQGALKHDKIMDPGHSDYVIVENEAEKVAREASLALKKSRSQCLPAMAGTPTWTGQHGGFKKPRFGQKKNIALAGSEKILNKEAKKKGKRHSF